LCKLLNFTDALCSLLHTSPAPAAPRTAEPARYLAAAEAAGVPIVAKTDLVSAICAAVPIR
jgi:hypothetical protein